MEGSLFYQALERARKTHKYTDVAPRECYQLKMADYLAQVSLCVKFSDLKFKVGIKALREFIAKDNSIDSLQETLVVFADFFGYIY